HGDDAIHVQIALTLTAEALELSLHLAVDVASARAVAAVLFGNADVERAMLEDLVKETANTIAGAVKRSALADGASMTIGIPKLADKTLPRSLACEAFACAKKDGGFALDCHFSLVEKPTRRVAASLLKEGMVVVTDVRAAGGAMLVAAGSRLTQSVATRLIHHLGERGAVDVVEAA
ncbi:MAG TPA: chemotaxis protein CheX, partial [Myxococcota bacterium]